MSATRLLILGALRFMQPAHGYAVREELESWHADEWANIAFGSIYHALNKMTQEGLLHEVGTERSGNRPARTTYAVTAAGDAEYFRLLREYFGTFHPLTDPFQVALSFVPDLPRDVAAAALRARREALLARIADAERELAQHANRVSPPHVKEITRLSLARLRGELGWLDGFLPTVESGALYAANQRWFTETEAKLRSGEMPPPPEEWAREHFRSIGVLPDASPPPDRPGTPGLDGGRRSAAGRTRS